MQSYNIKFFYNLWKDVDTAVAEAYVDELNKEVTEVAMTGHALTEEAEEALEEETTEVVVMSLQESADNSSILVLASSVMIVDLDIHKENLVAAVAEVEAMEEVVEEDLVDPHLSNNELFNLRSHPDNQSRSLSTTSE